MQEKTSIIAGTIIILIIALTIGVFVWEYENDHDVVMATMPITPRHKQVEIVASAERMADIPKEVTLDSADESSKSFMSEPVNEWVTISHKNYWNNTTIFPNSKYIFPNIQFFYPSTWHFRCCNDVDATSQHFVYPSENRDPSLPYIRITHHSLIGCSQGIMNCSINETTEISANEKFKLLISKIPKENILPSMKLDKLRTSAFVYLKQEKGPSYSKGYIVNINNAVIEIDFINYSMLNNTFIDDFLNRITFDFT